MQPGVISGATHRTPLGRRWKWIPIAVSASAALALGPQAVGASARPPTPLGPVQQLVPDPVDSYFGAAASMNARDTAVVGWTHATGPRSGRFNTELRWRRAGGVFGPVLDLGRGALTGLAIAERADRALVLRRVGGRVFGAVVGPGGVLFDGRTPARASDPHAPQALHVEADGSAMFASGPPSAGGTLQLFARPARGAWTRVNCAALSLVGVPVAAAAFSLGRGLVAAWQARGDDVASPFFAAVRAAGFAPAPATCSDGWALIPSVQERAGFRRTDGPRLAVNSRGDVAGGTRPVRLLPAGETAWRLIGKPPRGSLQALALAEDGTLYGLTQTEGAGVRPPSRLMVSRFDPAAASWRSAVVYTGIRDDPAYAGNLAVQRDGRLIAAWGIDIGAEPGPSGISVRSPATGVWSRPARRCSLRGVAQVATGNHRSLIVCGFEEDDTRKGVYAWDVLP